MYASLVTRTQLQIGEVAALAGVSIDTVRFYERLRLLQRPSRSKGGYRLFTSETVERIRFIKQAKEIGLSLDEIKQLLTSGGYADQCEGVRDLLREKISELDGSTQPQSAQPQAVAAQQTAEAQITFKVSGMTCTSCETIVRLALESAPGVRRAEVSYQQGEAVVTYDPNTATTNKLGEAINQTGYKVEGVR